MNNGYVLTVCMPTKVWFLRFCFSEADTESPINEVLFMDVSALSLLSLSSIAVSWNSFKRFLYLLFDNKHSDMTRHILERKHSHTNLYTLFEKEVINFSNHEKYLIGCIPFWSLSSTTKVCINYLCIVLYSSFNFFSVHFCSFWELKNFTLSSQNAWCQRKS